MLEAQSKPKRSYVLYILFIFLSSLLILVDYFSNKEISSYIPKSLTFEFNLNVFESTYIDSFNSLLTSRAEIVSENIRLEQEVKNLRALEIEISSLKEKVESFENISLIKNYRINLIQDNTFFEQQEVAKIAEYLDKIQQKYEIVSINKFKENKNPSILLGSLYLVGEFKKDI